MFARVNVLIRYLTYYSSLASKVKYLVYRWTSYLYGSLSLYQVLFLKEEGECRLMSSDPTNPLPLRPARVLKYLFWMHYPRSIYGSLMIPIVRRTLI